MYNKMFLDNGVPASGCDNAPLSYLIYSALFMPPFREGGAVLLQHFKRSRLFNFDLTSMEQTNDMFFPSMTSRYIEVGETFGMHANSCGDKFLIGSLMSLGGL